MRLLPPGRRDRPARWLRCRLQASLGRARLRSGKTPVRGRAVAACRLAAGPAACVSEDRPAQIFAG